MAKAYESLQPKKTTSNIGVVPDAAKDAAPHTP